MRDNRILYAPVLIPTLNRYEHFKDCFESLTRCTGAEYTDVYIGLDYPPNDKYVEGWEKINSFLKEKEQYHPFRSLSVFRRCSNCGVSGPRSNGNLLVESIKAKYDRYIFTEDDNVFSPNFLEYINKGFSKYNNDPTVFAIVGYAHSYKFRHGENNHYRHNTDLSAWGIGYWLEKNKKLSSFVENNGFKKTFSWKNIKKVKEHGWYRLFEYIHAITHKGYLWVTDGVMTSYLIINDMHVIVPTVSKVRNQGWDNSGCSSEWAKIMGKNVAIKHMNQKIDTDLHFDYIGDDRNYMEYNNKIAVNESDGYMSFFSFVRTLMILVIKKLKPFKIKTDE